MKKLLAMLALCTATTCVFAQSTPTQAAPNAQRIEQLGQQLQARFAKANTTQDGKLTRAQAEAGMPMVARHFDEIDTQKAGFITLPQIAQFMNEKRAAAN